jgi:hypothetical protein
MPTPSSSSAHAARTLWDDISDLNSAHGSHLKQLYAAACLAIQNEDAFIQELAHIARLKSEQAESELFELRKGETKPHLMHQESSPTTVASTQATSNSSQLKELWKSLELDIANFTQLATQLNQLRNALSPVAGKVDDAIHSTVVTDLQKYLITDVTTPEHTLLPPSDIKKTDVEETSKHLPEAKPEVHLRTAPQPTFRITGKTSFQDLIEFVNQFYASGYARSLEKQRSSLPQQDFNNLAQMPVLRAAISNIYSNMFTTFTQIRLLDPSYKTGFENINSSAGRNLYSFFPSPFLKPMRNRDENEEYKTVPGHGF